MDDPTGPGPLSETEGRPSGIEPAAIAIPDGLDATLVLVRHGESELIVQRRFQGRLETPLSSLGRRQAARVAARLAAPRDGAPLPIPDGPPRAIVHSPLSRAAETAIAIDTALGGLSPRRSDPRFAEIAQGDWEGRLASEIAATDGARLAAWRQRPTETWAPGGERLTDVRTRVVAGLSELVRELDAGDVVGRRLREPVAGYRDERSTEPWSVLVAHDGVFKVVLLSLFDLPLERFWMWTTDLCGITVIELRSGRAVVRAANLVDHLAGLNEEREAVDEAAERSRLGAL